MQAAQKQRLELADRFFADILTGKKSNTLRWNEGKITTGPLEFYTPNNPDLKLDVTVTNLKNGPLKDFAEFYKMNETELTLSMKKHYPDIQIDSNVVLVEFSILGQAKGY